MLKAKITVFCPEKHYILNLKQRMSEISQFPTFFLCSKFGNILTKYISCDIIYNKLNYIGRVYLIKSEDKIMKIPFSPPDISELEVNEVAEVLRSGWITTGTKTKNLNS